VFEITVENNESGDQEKVRCALDSCELGKSKDSILRVRGWKVAPRHVSLEKNLAGIFVKDISRGFGIKVNGSACVEFGPMKETDVIEFGSYKVSVRVSVTEQQAEANETLAKDDCLF
jgi:pilus assembly protein CpaF